MTKYRFELIRFPTFPEVTLSEYLAAKTLTFFWLVGTLGLLLFRPPFWALMDDASHLSAVHNHFQGMNFLQFIVSEIGGERFRPAYSAFIYIFYGIFWRSSQVAYLVVFAMTTAIFWIWANLFERSLRCFAADSRSKNGDIYRWLFMLFCFLFSPNFTLFFFASLQERLILLFASGVFCFMLRASEKSRISIADSIWMTLLLIMSLCSKETSVFLVPPMLIWCTFFYVVGRDRSFLLYALFLAASFVIFGLLFLSIRKSYSGGYQFGNLYQNLAMGGSRFYTPFFFSLCTGGIIAYSLFFFKIWRDVRRYVLFLWPLFLLSYLIAMLPWRMLINYYLIIPGGIFWTGCKLIVCFFGVILLSKFKLVQFYLIILTICFIASVPTARKLWITANRHHSTKFMVSYLRGELAAGRIDDSTSVAMPYPCIEASDALSFYVGKPKWIKVLSSNAQFLEPSENTSKHLLITHSQCTEAPSRFNSQQVIFRQTPWVVYEAYY